MRIHILGICGTFMGGLAVLAQQAGHTVTGCDANVYPPMSTQLREQGITLIEGYDPEQINQDIDLYVVGNAIVRGNPLMEAILNRGLPYCSGPAWMGEHILTGKWVLAVAGTHGKTTTSAMLAWILQEAGYEPGFLIGGVPNNFGISARLGADATKPASNFFVIEADEYDSAFFDKRSKFVHYRAKTAILNNLEYDHADIFPDLAAIETQFHHLVRTVPGIGQLVVNGQEPALQRVLQRGCWSEKTFFGVADGWHFVGDEVLFKERAYGPLVWQIQGEHNRQNALAAIAAAHHVGIAPELALEALSHFENVKRRMEVRGVVNNITVYDDFAHHPTAITTTIAGLRKKVGTARILAVLEPRSNTMKLGSMKAALPGSLEQADLVFAYGALQGRDTLGWDLAESLAPLGERVTTFSDLSALQNALLAQARPGDHILIMSNGGFGGIHQKLVDSLATNLSVPFNHPTQAELT
ncbi:UDP-N-acetylmuramate:L-alanyl-gamma-D-glutamyl-meso-diaminopimelate ligase [Solimicrobium silvestre]|uniref:UDP-N-acetylmuramate--L-alanyl-gamma-D-glutamyl-meso-2,6-diaminoheptandioate ligase n=1 Tax=Solimicrobium silvestre TaxID=2099400 RepID=A0A2S9GUD5_9BURK|nr:UDP-N-acetylmuramate:L-alanyl-gamma-D-glutamyl-meso-diaminopimelate ligase [Solimicrobium silvestre]PRC91345.1 mpl: UDP-N-acetylmuramate:L-alanyl-gamma-D-glutamyl-meso-diaminopimelate ligase [Solimicrobium silvestre]